MNIEDLDYELPERLIAQEPAAHRTASRLMVVHRASGRIEHQHFATIGAYLRPGDCLVLNETRVIPARFYIQRASGGVIEGLFLARDDGGHWQVLLKNAGRLKPEEIVTLKNLTNSNVQPLTLQVGAKGVEGQWVLCPQFDAEAFTVLESYGVPPLPPYIHRAKGDGRTEPLDRDRYQTVYARDNGSVAAPTAGLHFSEELLAQLAAGGIAIARLTLHVGLGTFKAIDTAAVEDYQIHAERYCLAADQSEIINQTVARGGRVIAVGTTSVRTLETCAVGHTVAAGEGWTRLFITPGYTFQLIEGMVTNFHLPRTSLLALVGALAGVELMREAYRQAVEQEYRFYSYGDAMLIL